MERNPQPETPLSTSSCSSPGPGGKPCWNLDLRLVALLLTLAAALILVLLYRLLQLRHRLQLTRARHALEYQGFYRAATYTLQHSDPSPDPPLKNGTIPQSAVPIPTVTSLTPVDFTPLPLPPTLLPPPPVEPSPPPPPLPRPLVRPPPALPPTPPVPTLQLPLPVIQATPPSPHLSWGACSEVDIYSRIGTFRESRLSTQSKVILFEHSSL
ncbi:36.4 kDa proline-rich protein-like isoform X2 [Cynoglossus semilaevis]|nr:36.4 kDa proline-rich protein-like isoform X2 [Cynoglossus semilaevis]